jgi:cell division protein ZapA
MTTADNNRQDAAASARVTGSSPAEGLPVKLRILDKDVQLACRPGEEDDLMQAAAYVDKSMRDLRQRNAASGIEKIAIVTAINTANALLKARSQQGEDGTLATRLASINEQLELALAEDQA